MLEQAFKTVFGDLLAAFLPQVKEAVAQAVIANRTQSPTLGAFLTIQQAADESGFAVTTLRERIKGGDLVASRPKGTREYRIRRADLELWLSGGDGAANEDAETESHLGEILDLIG
jgi:excisionase family DNA binding protein